jgi:hypothetical protein
MYCSNRLACYIQYYGNRSIACAAKVDQSSMPSHSYFYFLLFTVDDEVEPTVSTVTTVGGQ